MSFNPAPRADSWSTKLVSKLGNTFRSEKAYTQESIDKKNRKSKLKKKNPQQQQPIPEVNELGEQEYAVFAENRRPARAKVQDNGEMMHSLARTGSFDSLQEVKPPDPFATDSQRKRRGYLVSKPHEQRIASLPSSVWKRITTYLSPVETCNLALSTKTLLSKLGGTPSPFDTLNLPSNKNHKIAFLSQFDSRFPHHLLCFPCAQYHLRLHPGKEVLKKDFVSNPLFHCPSTKTSVLPRTRLCHGRELPYSFIQLSLRPSLHHNDPTYGISPDTLSRKWKCPTSPEWQHATRFLLHEGKFLMRVTSQRFAPPAAISSESSLRHVLYDREEYLPYFSVCAHWRDGELMKICKCLLSHIPSPPSHQSALGKRLHPSDRGGNLARGKSPARGAVPGGGKNGGGGGGGGDFLVRGCEFCRPARRCPECPTEYLVEARMVEDTTSTSTTGAGVGGKGGPMGRSTFRHAIVVTRWSDLGDGRNPYTSPEWRAVQGLMVAKSTSIPTTTAKRLYDNDDDDDSDDEEEDYHNHNMKSRKGSVPVTGKVSAASEASAKSETGGEGEEGQEEKYDSFTQIGRRSIGGIFESIASGCTPGQRLISLNPKGKKLGEEGNEWY